MLDLSWVTDIGEAYRQAGVYVARILRGDKPSDLPIMQATRFPLVGANSSRGSAVRRRCRSQRERSNR